MTQRDKYLYVKVLPVPLFFSNLFLFCVCACQDFLLNFFKIQNNIYGIRYVSIFFNFQLKKYLLLCKLVQGAKMLLRF